MMKIKLIVCVLLPFILYATPRIGRAQTTRNHFVTLQSETMLPAKALTKPDDVFNEQYVYEKSLPEANTNVYTQDAIKSKPEGVLKNVPYQTDLIFRDVKENYSIVAN